MKSFTASTAKLTFIALLLSCCTMAFSQKTIVWKGGTPGRTADWNCPSNWSTYAVPDEFSNVIIKDVSSSTLAPPQITAGRITVNSIYMETNTSLLISKGAQLDILDKAGSYIPNYRQVKGALFYQETIGTQARNAFTASN